MKQIVAILCLCFSAGATSAEVIVHGLFCTEERCWINSDKPVEAFKTGERVVLDHKCLLTEKDFFHYDRECSWKKELFGKGDGTYNMLPGGDETKPLIRWSRISLLFGLGLLLLAAFLFKKMKRWNDANEPMYSSSLRTVRYPFGLGVTCFVLALLLKAVDGIAFGQIALIRDMAIPAFLFAVIIAVDRFDYMYNGYAFRSKDFWKRFNAYLLWALVATYFI